MPRRGSAATLIIKNTVLDPISHSIRLATNFLHSRFAPSSSRTADEIQWSAHGLERMEEGAVPTTQATNTEQQATQSLQFERNFLRHADLLISRQRKFADAHKKASQRRVENIQTSDALVSAYRFVEESVDAIVRAIHERLPPGAIDTDLNDCISQLKRDHANIHAQISQAHEDSTAILELDHIVRARGQKLAEVVAALVPNAECQAVRRSPVSPSSSSDSASRASSIPQSSVITRYLMYHNELEMHRDRLQTLEIGHIDALGEREIRRDRDEELSTLTKDMEEDYQEEKAEILADLEAAQQACIELEISVQLQQDLDTSLPSDVEPRFAERSTLGEPYIMVSNIDTWIGELPYSDPGGGNERPEDPNLIEPRQIPHDDTPSPSKL